MKAGNEWQFLHGQLFGRLLIAMAVTTLNLCWAAEVLRAREPTQVINQSQRPTTSTCYKLWNQLLRTDYNCSLLMFKLSFGLDHHNQPVGW